MNREAKKRVKTLHYIRANIDEENKTTIYDYGLWNRFLVIREVEDETDSEKRNSKNSRETKEN